ncbi:amidohydrolase family protein [Desulfotomaculum defluvii]
MYKIIDGHVHLYPERLMKAILNWFEKHEGWDMPFKWPAEKHIEYLHNTGVSEIMVMAYASKVGTSQELNEWLANLTNQYPAIRPYACVHQDDIKKTEMLKIFLEQYNFYGVKIHCFVQRVSITDDRFREVLQLLSDRGKGLVLHASSMPAYSPLPTPDEVASLLREYTGIKIMIAHLGLPDYHNQYLKLLDKYENLYLDTAYIFGNQRYDIILGDNNKSIDFLKETLKNYPDKIIYGSDFPIMDYPPEKAIEHIRSFGLGEEREEKIFYSNAQRFMGR